MAVVQSVRALHWEFESQPRQTQVEKTVETTPLSNARQLAKMSRVLVDDLNKRMPCVTVGVTRLRTLTAQWP